MGGLQQEIKAWDSEKADQCLAGIGFASFLSSSLIGNYEWINSDNDRLLNWARTAVPSLLAPNISVPEGYGGKFLGHGFLDVYMSHPNSKGSYLTKLNDTAQLLDSSCDDTENCLVPLGKKGGQGEWTYTYPLNNTTPHAVEISFEAFAIPDKITIKANGNTIATTSTEVSGFHSWTFDYDPAIHGTSITAEVDAPDQNTEWQLCIDCAGAACEASSVPLERQSVFYNFSVDTSIWNCPATFTVDNEQSPSSGTRTLTEGSHTFGFNAIGFCYCDSVNSLACEQKKPKLTVRGTTYSLVAPNTEIKVNIGNSSTPGE